MGSDYHNHYSEQNLPSRKPEHGASEQYVEPSYREHVSGPLSYGGPGTAPLPGQQPAASPIAQPEQGTYTDPRIYQQPVAPQHPGAQQQAGNYPYPGTQPQAGAYPQNTYNAYYPGYPYPYYPYNAHGYYQPYAGSGQPWNGYPQQGQGTQQAYGSYQASPYYQYPYYQYPYAYAPYYPYAQPLPKGSTYQRVIAVITTILSSVALLTGLICTLTLLFVLLQWNTMGASMAGSKQGTLFSGITMLTALTIAGLGGGSFGLYHSIRALMRRKSIEFKLPSIRLRFPLSAGLRNSQQNPGDASGIARFINNGKLQIKVPWFLIFLILYIVMIAIGLAVRGNTTVASHTGLTVLLISLAGLLPALTVLTLGAWRVHSPRAEHWPTTWRRATMALVSGATSAILFASILELILEAVVALNFHNLNTFQFSDPNAPLPRDFSAILFMIILLSVIAPLVEESVKPLAVITMIGRIGSAAEAFTLGMACGIGFDLVETSSYIGMGYSNWVDVAIERSSAGLLHSFGAGMTALGWYFLTHKSSLPKKRLLIALGCFLYAILQHAIWNGSFLLDYLPDPVGPYLRNGVISIGSYQMSAELIVYAIETILMLAFFWFVTGRLSNQRHTPREQKPYKQAAPLPELVETRASHPQPLS